MAASNRHTSATAATAYSLRFAGYAATVFLASACLLVLEIRLVTTLFTSQMGR